MLVIYNLGALLATAVGVAVGGLAIILTGKVSLGVFMIAVAWVVLGGRKTDPQTGLKGPYPSIFFIPVRYGAVVPFFAACVFFGAEMIMKAREKDPHAVALKADETMLKGLALSGDDELSRALRTHLVSTIERDKITAGGYHIFTRIKPDAVLVLVQVTNLSDYEAAAREELVALISSFVKPRLEKEKTIYIGIRGRLAYGAMQVGSNTVRTGPALDSTPLHQFYK